MSKFLTRLSLSVAVLVTTTSLALADFELNVLHFNDFHSRIEPINKYDSTCSAEDETEGKCFGGIARMKTAIDQRKAALDNVLLLSAGDNFQGSLFYTTYKGAAEAEFMDQLGLDAMVLGNHEFDDGDGVLATFVDKTTFPIIYGNALIGADSPLAGKMVEYVIKDMGTEKIAIIGAVTADTGELSSPSDSVLFIDPVLYLNDAVAAVKAAGATKIIALTHTGFSKDKEIAAQVDGVDLIIGGHSNTFLSNTSDKADGVYPVMMTGPSGNPVAIVTAYAHSKYLGEIKIIFDDDGNIKSAVGEPILLDASFKPNEAMVTRIAEMSAPIKEAMEVVVASSTAPIDGDRKSCRARECEMGNLVADAMLERVASQGIQMAIQNGGGLRASIDGGDVTMGEVVTVVPFQNTLSTFKLKGSDVVLALENGVSQIEEGGGRFPQVAGLKFTVNTAKPAGERISDLMVSMDGKFVPLDETATYGVVSNNFMRSGGDGYKVFATDGMEAYDYGPGLEDVLANYLSQNTPYKPYLDGRITLVSMEPEAEMKDAAATDEAMPRETATEETATKETAASDTEMVKDAVVSEVKKVEEAVEETAMAAKTHVVTAGDNLWDLAKKYLGDGTRWGEIAKANPSNNPKKLDVGTELTIPAK
ncbi:MAG: 5'-nucleotidase C-terminal domain-containing protein [Rhizobiaceae bacterium]|nr:5'-nucleotidase C-terminal domain-containing protein [Rhizobiaceae bacterium]